MHRCPSVCRYTVTVVLTMLALLLWSTAARADEKEKKRQEKINRLSGGMKRRLLIAKAMIHDPPILILDEPTAGVDVELRRDLWLYWQEQNAAGRTIVLTTHYLEEAEALCKTLAIIDLGTIITTGTTGSVTDAAGGDLANYFLKERRADLQGRRS